MKNKIKRFITITLISVGFCQCALSNEPIKNTCKADINNYLINQFEPFRKQGITQDLLESYNQLPEDIKFDMKLSRFQIIDGEVYGEVYGSEVGDFAVLKEVVKIIKEFNLKNIDFLTINSEGIKDPRLNVYREIVKKLPIINIDKRKGDNWDTNAIIIPTFDALNGTIEHINQELESNQAGYDWNKKLNIIGWRGGTTDGIYKLENISKLPRLSLVMMSLLYPEYIDAKFSGALVFKNDNGKYEVLDLLKPFKITTEQSYSHNDMQKYKYLVSIDGNVSTWNRAAWILRSGSVLMLQTKWVQWFYPALKPFVHYIPLKEDMSDVLEQYFWLVNHDTEGKTIRDNGINFSKECLNLQASKEFAATALKEYADLQKFELNTPTLKKLQDGDKSFNGSKFNRNMWGVIRYIQSYLES